MCREAPLRLCVNGRSAVFIQGLAFNRGKKWLIF